MGAQSEQTGTQQEVPPVSQPQPEYQNGPTYQGGAGYQNGQGYQSQTSYQTSYQEKPVNWVPYLVLAIISTICCCPPFGIAKIWIIVAFAVGFIANLIMFFLGMAGEFSGYYYY